MPVTESVQRYADAIMVMIREDQDSGQVPGNVCSWDELDESVDTDDYYRQAQLPSGTGEAVSLRSAVSDEVTRRLSAVQGGPWGVTWTRPDGLAREIGRAIGYPARPEAELAGRAYVAGHGGSYQVHRA